MTIYRQHLAGTTYQFDGMVDLLAKATPLRSGDELSGCAASSDAERAAAQWALADVPRLVAGRRHPTRCRRYPDRSAPGLTPEMVAAVSKIMRNGTEGRRVVGVDGQPGDLIGVVRHHLRDPGRAAARLR